MNNCQHLHPDECFKNPSCEIRREFLSGKKCVEKITKSTKAVKSDYSQVPLPKLPQKQQRQPSPEEAKRIKEIREEEMVGRSDVGSGGWAGRRLFYAKLSPRVKEVHRGLQRQDEKREKLKKIQKVLGLVSGLKKVAHGAELTIEDIEKRKEREKRHKILLEHYRKSKAEKRFLE